jgi:hypothetical protein
MAPDPNSPRLCLQWVMEQMLEAEEFPALVS